MLGRKGPRLLIALLLIAAAGCVSTRAQQPDSAAVVRMVDAAVQARVNHVQGFTAIEHYLVYREDDESHPVAEMTVRDTYKRGVGKTYTILTQSGSAIVQRFGLRTLLDNERAINEPGKVELSWFTSSNYEMALKPDAPQQIDGRNCYALAVKAKRLAPNTIDGTLWVDSSDGSLVKVDGVASKNPSVLAGSTHMMRQYAQVDGYSMATHARAEASSMLFGRTVVRVEYSDYQLQADPRLAP